MSLYKTIKPDVKAEGHPLDERHDFVIRFLFFSPNASSPVNLLPEFESVKLTEIPSSTTHLNQT